MSIPMGLEGQAVFVTGGAKGMGRAITLLLAEAGADLVLAGRDTDALEAVAEEARALGRAALVVPCDVTDEASVQSAVASATRTMTPASWGLVNIAGGTGPSGKMLWEHSVADYHDVFDVNVLGPFLTMKHMLPVMLGMQAGAVVNIGGTFGFKGVRQASAYGATKWALRGFTKSAALEAGPFGVRVNMVSPGGVEGPRLTRQLGEAAVREGIEPQEAYDRFCRTAALGRMSTDQDVALSVLFLLGPGGRNITGQDLLVDGGTIV
ncbi:SDR family NAD(P)-dependent oxidoreductase [Roseisalinus antarcticus]|uniref:3-oxoacyl-[acyl-carrier-protein] reductase FabG n=1 Tax=Roseisalinus antarcticus TaxID=254357 RepID=A0A1Y5SJR4_9RHOB|nr:SDR family NAD(P)-dependent oxidoreductase [Roseisalinus antarcticus]SLN42292.1 3-oxoacyl-[acyl-carrier-protein] reductase FabG [Roseisalinus antarcticus]